MNNNTILGSTLGQLGQAVKQTAKQVVKLPEEMVQDVGGQVGGAPLRQGSEGQAKPAGEKPAASAQSSGEPRQWQSDEERIKFLRGLYGSTGQTSSPDSPDKSASSAKASAAKPDEQKKLMELRNQLHKENYYDPTFNPKNPKASGEDRPAEKVENEKKQEMQDLQKKEEKKPPPLAVVREQNKTEMFRGAAG